MKTILLLACFVAAAYAAKDDLTKEQEAKIIDIYQTVCPDPDKKSGKQSDEDTPFFCKLSAKVIANVGKKNNPSDSETTTAASDSETTTVHPADEKLDDESPNNSTTKYIQILNLMCSNNLDKADEESQIICKLFAKLVNKSKNEKETLDNDAPEKENNGMKHGENDNDESTKSDSPSFNTGTFVPPEEATSDTQMNNFAVRES